MFSRSDALVSRNNASKWNPASKHIRLDRYLFESVAYRNLSSGARDALNEFMYRYKGPDLSPGNGRIPLSVREIAERTNCAIGTAHRRIQELVDHGFIKVKTLGSFNLKQRHATEWTLTMYGVGKVAPTKEFMQWEKKNAVPTVDTDQCQPLTPSAVDGAKQ